MLSDMLPKQVLEEFQQDKLRLAYRHDRMTFLFADIVGFTSYANSVDATEVTKVILDIPGSHFNLWECEIMNVSILLLGP